MQTTWPNSGRSEVVVQADGLARLHLAPQRPVPDVFLDLPRLAAQVARDGLDVENEVHAGTAT
jgi:hypothetical protein